MPVLRENFPEFGADARPRNATFAGRALELGEFGGLLLPLQQRQGRPDAGRGGAETGAETAAVYATYFAAIDEIDWPS